MLNQSTFLKQVSVWNTAKTASGIYYDYKREKPNATDYGLVACFPLDEGSGSTVNDLSSTGINGSITGASWQTETIIDTLLVGTDSIRVPNRASQDFGARMYSNRLGRWLSIDPLEAKYPGLSPYNFVGNSPIFFIDPNGESIEPHGSAKEDLAGDFKKLFSHEMYQFLESLYNEETNLYSGTNDRDTKKKFKAALKTMESKEAKALARAYYKVITSEGKSEVYGLSPNEELSYEELGLSQSSIEQIKNLGGGEDGLTMKQLEDEIGGGINFPVNDDDVLENSVLYDNSSLINIDAVDEDERLKIKKTKKRGILYRYDKINNINDSPTERRAHEILGHNIRLNTGNTDTEHALFSIQISNLVRKVLGESYIRSGSDHQSLPDKGKELKKVSNKLDDIPKNLKK